MCVRKEEYLLCKEQTKWHYFPEMQRRLEVLEMVVIRHILKHFQKGKTYDV